jgi:hypothetical protein
MIAMLILKYLKASARCGWCLSNLVAFLRLQLFVKVDLQKLLDAPFQPPPETGNKEFVQTFLFEGGIDFRNTK